MSGESLYQRAAQELINCDYTILMEFNTGTHECRNIARELYERHGPFELDISDHHRERSGRFEFDWYDGGGDTE